MVAFIGQNVLSPVESFETSTVQLADEFNSRYQSLFDRSEWQKLQNQRLAGILSTLTASANNAISRSQTLRNTSTSAQSVEVARSDTLNSSIKSRQLLTSNTSAVVALNQRLTAVNLVLDSYDPQPFSATLQTLGTLPKVKGRILGYKGTWNYWAKTESDIFEVSAVHGSLVRSQGQSSNASFVSNNWNVSPVNTETSDLRGDGGVSNGISIPASGTTIIFGVQPLIAGSGQSEIWNSTIGGRMNLGSSHVGYVGTSNRSALWSNDSLAFAVGNYTSGGNFTYQMRCNVGTLPSTAGWASGTYFGVAGDEYYSRMCVVRIS